jgi:hypothetical protein
LLVSQVLWRWGLHLPASGRSRIFGRRAEWRVRGGEKASQSWPCGRRGPGSACAGPLPFRACLGSRFSTGGVGVWGSGPVTCLRCPRDAPWRRRGGVLSGADVWWWDADTERVQCWLEVAKGGQAGGPERARVSTRGQADAIDKGKCRYGFSGACVTWSDMQVTLKFGSPRGPEWHAGGTGKALTGVGNGQCSLICPAVTTSSAIVAQGRLSVGRRWPTALCSEGGEWVWLAGSQSRPGQSKRPSAIVRLEAHRREPSLLRRSVASLSTTARPAACFPGHATATVAARGRVFTQSHRHLTECLPYLPRRCRGKTRRNPYPSPSRCQQRARASNPNRALHVCRQLADLGPLASDASLVAQGLPKACLAPARYPITPHALTSSRCTILDCTQSPEDAAMPVLRHALAHEYWHPSRTKAHRLRSSHLRDQSAS